MLTQTAQHVRETCEDRNHDFVSVPRFVTWKRGNCRYAERVTWVERLKICARCGYVDIDKSFRDPDIPSGEGWKLAED